MKLVIQATRPIEIDLDEDLVLRYLKCLVRKLVNINTKRIPGIFQTLEMPLNLKNFKGELIEKVKLVCELSAATDMFGGPEQEFEAFLNNKIITFRFNIDFDFWPIVLSSPEEVKKLLMPSMIHELTHLVDSKSVSDIRKQEKSENTCGLEKFHLYMNQDSEVRAHLKQICFIEVDPLFIKMEKPYLEKQPEKSLEEVLLEIKSNTTYIKLFKYLNDSNQKKILKGIVTRYQDLLERSEIRKESSLHIFANSIICWKKINLQEKI